MKIKSGYKKILFLASAITAVILCILPFLATSKEVIYMYTQSPEPSSNEKGVIRELKLLGFNVILNSQSMPEPNTYGLWFTNPDRIQKIEQSPAKYDFLYTEVYFPIEWRGIKKQPIILTPYQDLYEHYVRSNIKTAKLQLGINTADFNDNQSSKQYNIVYYGDNNKPSPVAEYLKQQPQAKFLGAFWNANDNQVINISIGNPKARNKTLQKIKMVITFDEPNSPATKKIPQEVMEATASGALVFASPNVAIEKIYHDNVIIYESLEDLTQKIKNYQNNISLAKEKALAAEKITLQNISAVSFALKIKEIINWLKANDSN